jgi:hypothetical protein
MVGLVGFVRARDGPASKLAASVCGNPGAWVRVGVERRIPQTEIKYYFYDCRLSEQPGVPSTMFKQQ